MLPYVLFLMHDSYAQITSGSKGMLESCFSIEKRDIIMKMCREPVCDIALQLLNGSHPLLNKFNFNIMSKSENLLCFDRLKVHPF